MDKDKLIQMAVEYVNNSPDNYLSEEIALSKEVVGMKMFDEPIVGFASVDDECFNLLKKPDVVGEHFLLPKQWLDSAKTVISIFFPLSEAVKKSSRLDKKWPSNEWLHARIEGQAFIFSMCSYLKSKIEEKGYNCIVPSMSEKFSTKSPFTGDKNEQSYYTSNWSERHVAYICGLGTFSLSKAIITEKGIAGRLASLLVDYEIPPSMRPYSEIYENCIMCGACIKNCPVDAISFEKGKIHSICSKFLDELRIKYAPRYGCGKCKIKVPCENKIPKKR